MPVMFTDKVPGVGCLLNTFTAEEIPLAITVRLKFPLGSPAGSVKVQKSANAPLFTPVLFQFVVRA